MNARTVPAGLLVRLLLAVVLDTAVQILWKLGAEQLPGTASVADAARAALHQPVFLLVGGLFCRQLVNWLRVLEQSDLSYSQPITSLSFVSVFVISAAYLGESVGVTKVLGIALVFAGVWFISRTRHDTSTAAS